METNIYTGAFLAMCERVAKLLQTKVATLPNNTVLLRYIAALVLNIETIRELEAERKYLEKSPAKQIAVDKRAVEASRVKLAGALLAYASDEKNVALQERARQYSLKYNFRTDRDLKTNFNLLVKDARNHAKNLEPYYITEANIADAESLLLTLPESMNQTYVARDTRSTKTEKREIVQAEIKALFKDKLDPAVNALDDPDFVALYNRMRRLHISSANHNTNTAEPEGTVESGTRTTMPPSNEESASAQSEMPTETVSKPSAAAQDESAATG